MKTIETKTHSTCPRCDYTTIEGSYEVRVTETPGFWWGFAIATIGNVVVSVAWRLMGWG